MDIARQNAVEKRSVRGLRAASSVSVKSDGPRGLVTLNPIYKDNPQYQIEALSRNEHPRTAKMRVKRKKYCRKFQILRFFYSMFMKLILFFRKSNTSRYRRNPDTCPISTKLGKTPERQMQFQNMNKKRSAFSVVIQFDRDQLVIFLIHLIEFPLSRT